MHRTCSDRYITRCNMHILLRDTLGANYRLDIYLIVIGCAQMQTFFSVQGTTSTQQQQQRTKKQTPRPEIPSLVLTRPPFCFVPCFFRVPSSSAKRPRSPWLADTTDVGATDFPNSSPLPGKLYRPGGRRIKSSACTVEDQQG